MAVHRGMRGAIAAEKDNDKKQVCKICMLAFFVEKIMDFW